MSMRPPSFVLAALVLAGLGGSVRADEYTVDGVHSTAVFRVSHLGLSWTYGRFKDVSGSFTVDAKNPAATSFELKAKVESLDTDNAKRNEHLKSPDFFNAKQYPSITLKSKSVKSVKGGYEVTGDLTMHGKTKSVTFTLAGGRTAEFPKGVQRTGYVGELTIKRSDFGMNKMLQAIGDEIRVELSFEGTKK
jgi:polyisoprenoid-binding protein YceI